MRKCRPMSLVSRYVRIFAEVPRGGGQLSNDNKCLCQHASANLKKKAHFVTDFTTNR